MSRSERTPLPIPAGFVMGMTAVGAIAWVASLVIHHEWESTLLGVSVWIWVAGMLALVFSLGLWYHLCTRKMPMGGRITLAALIVGLMLFAGVAPLTSNISFGNSSSSASSSQPHYHTPPSRGLASPIERSIQVLEKSGSSHHSSGKKGKGAGIAVVVAILILVLFLFLPHVWVVMGALGIALLGYQAWLMRACERAESVQDRKP